MSRNGGADCQVSSAGIKPWFNLHKSWFLALKLKTQCIGWKQLGSFHPCMERVKEEVHLGSMEEVTPSPPQCHHM